VRPVIVDGALGEAQGFGGFNVSHPRELTQPDHFSLDGVDGGERFKRLVHRQELFLVARRRNLQTLV